MPKAVTEPQKADAAPERKLTRHEVRRTKHEENPRYWIFRRETGIFWVRATGQAEARELAGDHNRKHGLLYKTAGACLRVCEMQAAHYRQDIENLSELQKLAASDPEPESGASLLHAERKKAK